MRKIIIEISGGNIQEIYSTEKENDAVSIYVIDWDNINACSVDGLSEFPLTYVTKLEFNEIVDKVNDQIDVIREEVNGKQI